MDIDYSIPFSSLIAGMLLYSRRISSVDVINMMSKLTEIGVCVDDEDDSIDYLSICVDFDSCCSFQLKNNYDYQTLLCNGMTVFQFLRDAAGEETLSFLAKYIKKQFSYQHMIDDNAHQLCIDCQQGLENVESVQKKVKMRKKVSSIVLASFFGGYLLK